MSYWREKQKTIQQEHREQRELKLFIIFLIVVIGYISWRLF